MIVAQGMETSASLSPPPKSDTQPITASGQWTTSQPTRKVSPCHPREPDRQELLRAAESGRLAFRRIYLTEEQHYFLGKGAPRPFTLALPGEMLPTEPVEESCGESMIGVVNPQCLYVYKRDAHTRHLAWGADPDKLPAKLLPDLHSLHDGLLGRANTVIWGVYPRFTSGHLQADGTFSLPKLKLDNDSRPSGYPEVVLTQYSKEDIKCFCVYNDAQINISDLLWDKLKCESALNLPPLPLVIYCHRTGSVQVYFDDELKNPYLTMNERSLNDFAYSKGITPDHFRAILNLLPMSLRAEALSSELTVSPDVRQKLQQAIDLVSDPDSYNYEKLLELKQSGLPIHQRFFHENGVRSLLRMLLTSEMLRNGKPRHEQTRKQEEEACRLCELLLQSGARLERSYSPFAMMDNPLNPVMPPSMMNYLVAAFAPFDFLTLEHLRRIPLAGCPGNVVEFDRICREYTPQQRLSFLERLTNDYVRGLNPPTLETLQSLLLALFHYDTSMEQRFLNHLKVYLEWEYRDGKKIIGDLSLNDYIQWLDNLFKQRKEYPFYQNWPEYVRKAHVQIAELKQSLDLPDDAS
uniref:hypothetical protein n=2 Tax=unclassified Endozoicomonas TaxID=2644528 RepID=UPI0021498AFD